MTQPRSKAKLQIRYESAGHEIGIITLTEMLSANEIIFRNILRLYPDKCGVVEIKVGTPQKGSFLCDIWLECTNVLSEVNNVVGILGGYVTVGTLIWKLFRKKKGKSISRDEKEQLKISLRKEYDISPEEAETVIKVYNVPTVRKHIEKAVNSANYDTSVNGIEFISNNTQSLEFTKNDLEKLSEIEPEKKSMEIRSSYREALDYAANIMREEGEELPDTDDARFIRYTEQFYKNKLTRQEYLLLVRTFTNRKIED